MESKQTGASPLDRTLSSLNARSVSPLQARQARPAAQLNSRQIFSTALRRTDISPGATRPQPAATEEKERMQSTGKGWSKTTTYENVEKLIQEADSLKSQMQLRSELGRREPRSSYSSARQSADRPLEFREITNLRTLTATQLKDEGPKDHYKELYEKAIAQHATEKQQWESERQELIKKIERLEGRTQVPDSQVYLQKINREIEELKDRVRRTEQQNESIRARCKKVSN